MGWQSLLEDGVARFIRENEHADVKTLALKKSPDPSWDYHLILDQIKVRQKARLKSPDLYETSGILFPAALVYEQASSSACAIYKSSLAKGHHFIDLTAGSGIDSYYLSKSFGSGVLVERDAQSAALLKHNMEVLSASVEVLNADACDFIKTIEKVDFIFIDPQRRENGRKGIYDLAECSPNVIEMMPVLRQKASLVMIKTSPVLDIEKAILSLKYVRGVYVVQWCGECKEVLYLLDFQVDTAFDDVLVTAVDLGDDGVPIKQFSYRLGEEKCADIEYSLPMKYIYEPSAAFQKSGGFQLMAVQFNVAKLHQHTHLYTSDVLCKDFPGKCYELLDILPVKSKSLRIKKADLTVRNFPSTVQELRRKLGVSDGGDHRIFATTLCDEEKRLLVCHR